MYAVVIPGWYISSIIGDIRTQNTHFWYNTFARSPSFKKDIVLYDGMKIREDKTINVRQCLLGHPRFGVKFQNFEPILHSIYLETRH